jgi:zinc protease
VVAVGDFDPERAAEQLAGCFGDLPAAAAIEIGGSPATGIGATPGAEVREREKAQSAFAMLFAGPTRRDPERHAADVWAAIAAGLGGRLFEALRDRRSLAYTVSAFPWQRRWAGALITYIAMAPEREEEARQAMLEELVRFGAAPPTEREVSQSVNFLTGIREVGRQSAAVLVSELLDAWLHGTGLQELADPSGPYRAVTPSAVQAVAARYLDPARRVEGVVRGTRASRG